MPVLGLYCHLKRRKAEGLNIGERYGVAVERGVAIDESSRAIFLGKAYRGCDRFVLEGIEECNRQRILVITFGCDHIKEGMSRAGRGEGCAAEPLDDLGQLLIAVIAVEVVGAFCFSVSRLPVRWHLHPLVKP
mgnify:CR=1 FL=1